MRCIPLLGLAVALAQIVHGQIKSVPISASGMPATVTPASLLEESHQLAADFVPYQSQRLQLLLAAEALPIDADKAGRWSSEVFWQSFQLPFSWDRGALQKNALAQLSKVDPEKAFEMRGFMDSPLRDSAGILREDLRAHGARQILKEYWKKGKDEKRLAAIRSLAQSFAANGQYPFLAVSSVLQDVLRADPPRGNAWLSEIARAAVDSSSAASNVEFVAFLKAVWGDLSDVSQRLAIDVLLPRLTSSGDASREGAFLANVETTKGRFQLHKRNELLVLQIMPWLLDIAAEHVKEIIKLGPAFAASAGEDFRILKVQEVNVLTANGETGVAQATKAAGIVEDRGLLDQVGQAVEKDPIKAFELARRIQDPSLRSAAIMTVADSAGKYSAVSAARLSKEISKSTTDEDLAKNLPLLIVLASTAAAVGNQAELQASLAMAFDSVEDLFKEYERKHPGAVAEDADVMEPARHLINIGMSANTSYTLERIRRVSNSLLKAYLLVDAAVSLKQA